MSPPTTLMSGVCFGGPLDGREVPVPVNCYAFAWPYGWYYWRTDGRFIWRGEHYIQDDHDRWRKKHPSLATQYPARIAEKP